MSSKNRAFHDHILLDVFADIPGITSKSMFGGWGFYKDGIIFAIIAENQLYFKVDDINLPNFEKLNSHPFLYQKDNNKQTTMPYWQLPESIWDDPHELKKWVDESVQASMRSKKKKN